MGWSASNAVLVDNLTIDRNASQQLEIKNGGIDNTLVAAGAAIGYSKLNLATSIVNADVATNAAVAYSKLNLGTSIVNADVATNAALAYSKLNLASSILNADVASNASIAFSKLAALNSANILVGNGSNVATPVSMSQDATMDNTGALTIARGLKFIGSASWTATTVGASITVSGQSTYYVVCFCTKTQAATGNTLQLKINSIAGTNYSWMDLQGSANVLNSGQSQIVLVYDNNTGSGGGFYGFAHIVARNSSLGSNVTATGHVHGAPSDSNSRMANGGFWIATSAAVTSIKIDSSVNTTGTMIVFQEVGA